MHNLGSIRIPVSLVLGEMKNSSGSHKRLYVPAVPLSHTFVLKLRTVDNLWANLAGLPRVLASEISFATSSKTKALIVNESWSVDCKMRSVNFSSHKINQMVVDTKVTETKLNIVMNPSAQVFSRSSLSAMKLERFLDFRKIENLSDIMRNEDIVKNRSAKN